MVLMKKGIVTIEVSRVSRLKKMHLRYDTVHCVSRLQ